MAAAGGEENNKKYFKRLILLYILSNSHSWKRFSERTWRPERGAGCFANDFLPRNGGRIEKKLCESWNVIVWMESEGITPTSKIVDGKWSRHFGRVSKRLTKAKGGR